VSSWDPRVPADVPVAPGLPRTIRSRRRQLGLTLVEAAGLAGVSQSQLSRVERGLSRPSPDTARRLREVLDLASVKASATNHGPGGPRVGEAMPVVHASWPLVGRRRELASIVSAMTIDEPRGLVLAGAEGVGKTRLAREALAVAASRGRPTAWVAGVQAAISIPFGAFASLVSLPRARVQGQHRLLGTATRSLLGSVGGGGVLVLGVDDAHFLDGLSASFVRHLAVSGSAFVVATVRSGEEAPDAIVALWKDGFASRLEVPTLSWPATAQLLRVVLGGYIELRTQRDLWDASQGHVLYLRELVLGGIETGALSDEEGIWRWRGPPIPGKRVSELVLSRLRTLTKEQQRLVEVLAIGGAIDMRVVDRLAPPRALIALESRGLVQIDVARGRPVLRLAHPLYGEVFVRRSGTGSRSVKRWLVRALEGVGAA
jgi:hypothetical protein